MLNFTPQAGHEQAGFRPALVISPKEYNERLGLALVCPITSKIKGLSFEVILEDGCQLQGAILSDQLKSMDWQTREARFIEKISPTSFNEVIERFMPLVLGV